jgi:hypothetical protein
MKTTKLTQYFLIAFLCLNTLVAQTTKQIPAEDRKGQWFFGLGLNIVDDDFTSSLGPSNNFTNPYIFDAEYTLNNNFGFYGNLSFNKYIAGKVVDYRFVQEGDEANYIALDLGSNYYFRKKLKNYKFEPYVSAGLGFTHISSYTATNYVVPGVLTIPSIGRLTINAGFGSNYWFSPTWGMNVNAMIKYGLSSNIYVTSLIQYSFGVMYKVGTKNKQTEKTDLDQKE